MIIDNCPRLRGDDNIIVFFFVSIRVRARFCFVMGFLIKFAVNITGTSVDEKHNSQERYYLTTHRHHLIMFTVVWAKITNERFLEIKGIKK